MNVQVLSEYLEYLEIEKGLSENTIEAYRRDLSDFLDFCDMDVTEVQRNNLNSYIRNLREKEYSATSVMRKIASLRGFFKWLCASEICKTNPTLTLEQPKVPKRLPKVMTVQEIETILNENLNKQAYIGTEAMATWTDHIGDFNYRVSGNITFSRYRNIESYKPRFSNSWDEYRNSSEDRWGGIYWGYQVIGQFQSEEEIKNYPVNLDGQGNTTLLPGDLIYKDVNNDGVINSMDERPIGFPEGWAPILSFGGNIGLEWKGIDLNIDFSGGAMQGWRQNYELTNAYHNGGNSPAYLLEDRWHRLDLYDPESEWVPGRYPAIRNGEFAYNNKNSDFWLHNVHYLRISNLEIGYSLPTWMLKPIHAQKVRIYGSVSNLCSFDNVHQYGIDPEITAAAAVVYPQQRTFLVGFNVTF